jgi:hypothetical protein
MSFETGPRGSVGPLSWFPNGNKSSFKRVPSYITVILFYFIVTRNTKNYLLEVVFKGESKKLRIG